MERFDHMNIKKNDVRVILEIQGKNGRMIDDMSQFGSRNEQLPNQKEVLFDKGSRLKFIKSTINDNCMVITIEEV